MSSEMLSVELGNKDFHPPVLSCLVVIFYTSEQDKHEKIKRLYLAHDKTTIRLKAG